MPPKRIRKQYYFFPFSVHTDQGIDFTTRKYTLKTNCDVLSSPIVDGALSAVESYATLLIDGHGTRDCSTKITADVFGYDFGYPIVKLAYMIANAWRLPQSHVKIRMLSCWGGVSGVASGLAKELATQGYDNIRVAGYTGSVQNGVYESGTGRGSNPVILPDGKPGYEKSRVRWFDGNGNLVDKPDVGEEAFVGVSDSLWG